MEINSPNPEVKQHIHYLMTINFLPQLIINLRRMSSPNKVLCIEYKFNMYTHQIWSDGCQRHAIQNPKT